VLGRRQGDLPTPIRPGRWPPSPLVGVAQHGNGRGEYHHHLDDRMIGVDVAHREQPAGAHPDRLLPWQTSAVTYGVTGDLKRLETSWLTGAVPHTEITYRRPPEDFSIIDLCGAITDRLVKLVPETIASARLSGPAYCLVLTYDGTTTCPRSRSALRRSGGHG